MVVGATGLEDRIRLFVRAALDDHRGDPAPHRVLFEDELVAMLVRYLTPMGRPRRRRAGGVVATGASD
ncbi:hypothetical protein GCM10010182_46020 [Actinomadura cremea]|nr:hypothetical protein GCM10010182_46020 [Actinomadura cremea]